MIDTPIAWKTVRSLLARGVPLSMAPKMVSLRVVDGQLAFYEEVSDDVVLWRLETGELSSLHGRAFALGEENILNAGTYSLDRRLMVYDNPLQWLQNEGRGIVPLRWDMAFDWLRDAPRVTVTESLLPAYRKAMKPSMPELAVLCERRMLA